MASPDVASMVLDEATKLLQEWFRDIRSRADPMILLPVVCLIAYWTVLVSLRLDLLVVPAKSLGLRRPTVMALHVLEPIVLIIPLYVAVQMLGFGVVALCGLWMACLAAMAAHIWLDLRRRGLAQALPASLQVLLFETRLVDYLRDSTLGAKLAKYVPFIVGMTDVEAADYLARAPPRFRERLLRPGLVGELPEGLQGLLLPADAGAASSQAAGQTNEAADATSQTRTPAAGEGPKTGPQEQEEQAAAPDEHAPSTALATGRRTPARGAAHGSADTDLQVGVGPDGTTGVARQLGPALSAAATGGLGVGGPGSVWGRDTPVAAAAVRAGGPREQLQSAVRGRSGRGTLGVARRVAFAEGQGGDEGGTGLDLDSQGVEGGGVDVLLEGDLAGARSSSRPPRTPAVVNFATPLSGVASVAADHEHEANLERTPEGSIGSAATGNSAGGWTAGVMRTPAMRSLRSARRWVQQWSAAPAVVQDAELVLPSVADTKEQPGADTTDRAGQSTGKAGPDGSEARQRSVPGTAIRRAARSLAAVAPIALPALRLQMLKRLLSARKKQTGQQDAVHGAASAASTQGQSTPQLQGKQAGASERDGQGKHGGQEAEVQEEEEEEEAAWHRAFMAGLVRRRIAGALRSSGALALVGGAEAAVGRVLRAADQTAWLQPGNLQTAAAVLALLMGGGLLASGRARRTAGGMALGAGLGAGAASVLLLLAGAAVLRAARARAGGARPSVGGLQGMVGAVLGMLPELPGGRSTWMLLLALSAMVSMRRGGSLRRILQALGAAS